MSASPSSRSFLAQGEFDPVAEAPEMLVLLTPRTPRTPVGTHSGLKSRNFREGTFSEPNISPQPALNHVAAGE